MSLFGSAGQAVGIDGEGKSARVQEVQWPVLERGAGRCRWAVLDVCPHQKSAVPNPDSRGMRSVNSEYEGKNRNVAGSGGFS